jgi:hypothetical protein
MTTGRATAVDESWLLWVAAVATEQAPEAVLRDADVAAVVSVVAAVEAVADPVDRAVAVLDAVLVRRPFGPGSRAVAWLSAVMVMAEAGRTVTVGDDEGWALVAAAERGDLSQRELAARLRSASAGASRRVRVAGRCPSCSRTLHVLAHERVGGQLVLVGSSRFELMARCWYEHRAHDRDGGTLQPAPDGTAPAGTAADGWRPVVSGCSSGTFLVLVDDGVLVFVPAGPDQYAVFTRREVSAGELTARWDALASAQGHVADVPSAAVRMDPRRRMLDCDWLAEWDDGILAAALRRPGRAVPA